MATPIPLSSLRNTPQAPDSRASHSASETLTLRRIFILPTRYGLVYGAMLVVMLLGAINYNNSMAYMLTFLLTGLGLVGMLHTWRNLAGLTFTGRGSKSVFAGDRGQFVVSCDNSAHPCRTAITLRGADIPEYTTNIAANQASNISMNIETAQRGRLQTGRLVVDTRFPLGLFRAWSNILPGVEILVWPKPAGDSALPHGLEDGQSQNNSEQQGADDFYGFRDYVPGDSPRHVHWKAMARSDHPIVKVFTGESGNEPLLRWQDTEHLHDTEARLSQLCLWIVESERAGYRYGLELPGIIETPASGEAHRRRCLDHLAAWV